MPDYTGGYTGAINDLTTRRYRDIQMQQMLQGLTQRQMIFQQEQEDRQRAIMGAEKGVSTLAGMQPPTEGGPPPLGAEAPPTPPGLSPSTLALFGPQAGPQSPMPGQPSAPMQAAPPGPPPVAPMAPPVSPPVGPTSAQAAVDPQAQALARGLAKGGPMQVKVSPQGQITSTPPGWRPSPAAPPTLGGAPPAPAAPGGAPAVPPPPSFPRSAPALQQGKMIDPKEFLAAAIKQGATPREAYDQLKAMEPAIDAHNKQIINQFGEQAKIAQAVINYQNMLLRAQREGRLADAFTEREKRLQEREDRLSGRGGAAAPAKGGARGAAGAGQFDQGVIDFYAAQQLGGDTTWRTGLSRRAEGTDLILAVDKRAPELAKEWGLGPGEIGTNKAKRAGLTYALRQRQNFVAAGNQYVRNLQSQADLVEKYMTAGAAGGVPAFNRWIQAGRKSIAGDPDVTALDVAIRGLAREHQRIVTGVTSNAQLHVAAQQTADELLNKDQAPEQMRASIKVMREEADNAIRAGQQEMGSLEDQLTKLIPKGAAPAAGSSGEPPQTNAKGWKLMVDKNGNRAYVSPDRKQFEALP